jgi:hypothetical protein
LFQGLFAGITINALFAFGEELGWRGFLLRQFRQMSFIKASLTIGFIWGIWHAPMILMGHNYPQHPEIGVLMMIVFCILITPFHLYITIKAKSVIAAAILHGTLNATAAISIIGISGNKRLIPNVAKDTNGINSQATINHRLSLKDKSNRVLIFSLCTSFSTISTQMAGKNIYAAPKMVKPMVPVPVPPNSL